jgi:hypothetical protein
MIYETKEFRTWDTLIGLGKKVEVLLTNYTHCLEIPNTNRGGDASNDGPSGHWYKDQRLVTINAGKNGFVLKALTMRKLKQGAGHYHRMNRHNDKKKQCKEKLVMNSVNVLRCLSDMFCCRKIFLLTSLQHEKDRMNGGKTCSFSVQNIITRVAWWIFK